MRNEECGCGMWNVECGVRIDKTLKLRDGVRDDKTIKLRSEGEFWFWAISARGGRT